MRYYSPSARACSTTKDWQDAVEVEDAAWAALMAGQAEGQEIVPGPGGAPILQAAPVNLVAYANFAAQALLAEARSYTSGGTTLKSDATQGSLADWIALQQWAVQSPGDTKQWVGNDNTVTALPASAVDAIAEAVGAYRQAMFQALASALTGIDANMITGTAAIDAAFAALA